MAPFDDPKGQCLISSVLWTDLVPPEAGNLVYFRIYDATIRTFSPEFDQ